MAPIHHHFELCGWSETRLVAIFYYHSNFMFDCIAWGYNKMDIKGKQVLVFGSGISGVAASRLLMKEGAVVILYDGNQNLDAEKISEDIRSEIQADASDCGSIQVITGELPETVMDRLSLVVMSPGVPTDLPVVEKMRTKRFRSGERY